MPAAKVLRMPRIGQPMHNPPTPSISKDDQELVKLLVKKGWSASDAAMFVQVAGSAQGAKAMITFAEKKGRQAATKMAIAALVAGYFAGGGKL